MKYHLKNKAVFIIGTDTGVGKTFISAVIAKTLIADGINCGIMKPIESGCKMGEYGLIPSDGTTLKEATGVKDSIDLITPYRLKNPLAPYAAILEGEEISISFPVIKEAYEHLSDQHSFLIVEGMGGLMVPLSGKHNLVDLIRYLNMPVLLVARSGLGTLNHILLTLQCGLEAGLVFSGIMLNRSSEKPDSSEASNVEILKKRTNRPILGPFPYFKAEEAEKDRINQGSAFLQNKHSLKAQLYKML